MKQPDVRLEKEFLRKRMGSISQLAGIRRYEFVEGRAKGVEACEVNNGSGLLFTVLPGRGMDIAWASFRGVPFSYMSKAPVSHPAYYEREGGGWLRNFFAGLLTTCGLCNVGGASAYTNPILGELKQGLHGGITNATADQVCVKEEWVNGEYALSVSGRMREAQLHGESLSLSRRISTVMGRNAIRIDDTIENESCKSEALMLLYHINLGYPFLDEGARFEVNSRQVTPNDDFSRAGVDSYARVEAPQNGIFERVYFHDVVVGDDGIATAALVNDTLEAGVYVRYDKNALPYLTQWKMMAESEYVLGIEPGNCKPKGRAFHEKEGTLCMLAPGETRHVWVEIGILDGAAEIGAFRASNK